MVRLTWMMCLLALCGTGQSARAGWPFSSESGVRHGSKEYYEMRAPEPPGRRQKYHYGKLWPPFPRPVGPELPCAHKYHAAHYWPYPYVCEDRAFVRSMIQTQIHNGWLQATTLYEYHFHPLTQELNSAGKTHLHWILSHAPEEFRQAYVAVAEDTEQSNRRVLSVEREIAKVVGDQQGIPVGLRMADPVGRPADEVRKIFVDAQNNQMPPAIEYTGVGSSNVGGGN